MRTVLFDTEAMIRVGGELRHYRRVTDPIASAMGKVPAGLPPSMGDVEATCHFLQAGVNSLGDLIQGMGSFAVALGERVKAADEEGNPEYGLRLARIALIHMPAAHTTVVGGTSLARLQKLWPDVFNSMDDIRHAEAVDELMKHMSAASLHNLDAIAAYRRRFPGRPVPSNLRSISRTMKAAGRLASVLESAGIATSMIAQILKDMNRNDLSAAEKSFRAAQAGAIDVAAGRASSTGLRWLMAKLGLKTVEGPVGWIAMGFGALLSAVGADKAAQVVSGEILFEPNRNSEQMMKLPTAIRSRIEIEGRGPGSWPDITHPTPKMRSLLDEAHAQEGRINDLYARLHSPEPLDPIDYRTKAYDLIRELDHRNAIAHELKVLESAKR
ncbi:MAG: hypothetical protein QOE11_2149 [Solirubrobacteraceae bacterium]|jgi:hypothetical protein|nr:hypothetical protein [Solirubrobacteraceae bacterium]